MADHSLSALNESHEGEASQSLTFWFYNASLEESCYVLDLVYLFRCTCEFLCLWVPYKGGKASTIRFVSFGEIVETKERSSLSPQN